MAVRIAASSTTTTDLGARDLSCDRENGHARTVRIIQTVNQMQIAGAATAGANGKRASEMRLCAGRERGSLFVSRMDPFDIAAAAQRVGYSIETVADDSVDSANTG
jgi:hypothetical protein